MQHIFIHDDHLKNLNHKKHILMSFLGISHKDLIHVLDIKRKRNYTAAFKGHHILTSLLLN